MGSHSVTCHPAEVTFPPLPQPKLVLDTSLIRYDTKNCSDFSAARVSTSNVASSTEQVARPATKRFHPSHWRALEACCGYGGATTRRPSPATRHRRNFVCDDNDLSPPLLKVVVTVTTAFGQETRIFLATRSACGLKYAENAIATGAPPRTPLGELTTPPRSPSRLGERTPLPIPNPTRRLWRLDARAFGASIVVPPLTPNPGDATAAYYTAGYT